MALDFARRNPIRFEAGENTKINPEAYCGWEISCPAQRQTPELVILTNHIIGPGSYKAQPELSLGPEDSGLLLDFDQAFTIHDRLNGSSQPLGNLLFKLCGRSKEWSVVAQSQQALTATDALCLTSFGVILSTVARNKMLRL